MAHSFVERPADAHADDDADDPVPGAQTDANPGTDRDANRCDVGPVGSVNAR
jgi:hypothetical protein